MRSKNSPVAVHFVNRDHAKGFQKLGPVGMPRQNRRMEHVRIRQHDIAKISNAGSMTLRRIAIVG